MLRVAARPSRALRLGQGGPEGDAEGDVRGVRGPTGAHGGTHQPVGCQPCHLTIMGEPNLPFIVAPCFPDSTFGQAPRALGTAHSGSTTGSEAAYSDCPEDSLTAFSDAPGEESTAYSPRAVDPMSSYSDAPVKGATEDSDMECDGTPRARPGPGRASEPVDIPASPIHAHRSPGRSHINSRAAYSGCDSHGHSQSLGRRGPSVSALSTLSTSCDNTFRCIPSSIITSTSNATVAGTSELLPLGTCNASSTVPSNSSSGSGVQPSSSMDARETVSPIASSTTVPSSSSIVDVGTRSSSMEATGTASPIPSSGAASTSTVNSSSSSAAENKNSSTAEGIPSCAENDKPNTTLSDPPMPTEEHRASAARPYTLNSPSLCTCLGPAMGPRCNQHHSSTPSRSHTPSHSHTPTPSLSHSLSSCSHSRSIADAGVASEAASLLPGLPDDVALLCLLRVARGAHLSCQAVSRLWRKTFRSASFHAQRRELGLLQPMLALRVARKNGKAYQWYALGLPLPGQAAAGAPTVSPAWAPGREAGNRDVQNREPRNAQTKAESTPLSNGGTDIVQPRVATSEQAGGESNSMSNGVPPSVASGEHAGEGINTRSSSTQQADPVLGTPGGVPAVRPPVRWGAGGVGCRDVVRLPDPPFPDQCSGGGHAAVVSRGEIYLLGGMSGRTRANKEVYRLDMAGGRWYRAPSMLVARAYFGCWPLPNGDIMVAGGHSHDLRELHTGEVYDAACRKWREGPGMPTEVTKFACAEWRGRLLISEGWHWPFHFSPRGFSFDLASRTWGLMEAGMCEGWTGPSFVWRSHLMAVVESQPGKHNVVRYEPTDDSWHPVEGSEIPGPLSSPLQVATHGDSLLLVGRGIRVAVARLSEPGATEGAIAGATAGATAGEGRAVEGAAPRLGETGGGGEGRGGHRGSVPSLVWETTVEFEGFEDAAANLCMVFTC